MELAALYHERWEIETGALEFAGIEGPSPEQRNVLRPMIEPSAALILVHRDIRHPVKTVLDRPVATHDRGETLGG